MFLIACIFSGCDYLESVKGVGLKRAIKLVSENPDDTVKDCLHCIKSDTKLTLPRKYERNVNKALLTFMFQRVWCPE